MCPSMKVNYPCSCNVELSTVFMNIKENTTARDSLCKNE